METVLDASISYILENELDAYRTLILEYKKAHWYPQDTTFSTRGAPVDCLYFLTEGLVKVLTNNINGYLRIVGYHKKNTFFAMDHLEPGTLAVVTTKSITPVRAVPLYGKDLLGLNELDPTFFPALLRYYGHVLRLMCFDAENQSIGDTTTRLANFLFIYMRSGEYQKTGYVAMTQEELASAVNASRVQVARICAKLRKEGSIQVAFKKLYILDPYRIETMMNNERDLPQ